MTLKRPRPTQIDLSPHTGPRSWSTPHNCVKQEKAIDITEGDDADDDLLMKLNLMWGQVVKQNEKTNLAEQIRCNVERMQKLQQLEQEALTKVQRYRRRQMFLKAHLAAQCDKFDALGKIEENTNVPVTLMEAHIRVSEIEVFQSDTPEAKSWLECLKTAIHRLEKEARIHTELPDKL